MSPIVKAAGLVIFRVKEHIVEFLMMQTSYGEHHWTPPKGHVDPGESDYETAIRETFEEAGLCEQDLEIYKDITKTLCYNVTGAPKAVVYWLAKIKNVDQNITLSNEHQDYKWLVLNEAQDICGYSDMKQLLTEFHEKAKCK